MTSIKGYIMRTLPSKGSLERIVHACTIAEAKEILLAETGIEWFFKGYSD